MSVFIKGMEMPQDGEMLCINIYPDGKVCLNLDLECKRIATAVSVPPHGRLKDADAYLSTIKPIVEADSFAGCTFETMKLIMINSINNAPTVIEAEEGK